MMNAQDTLNAYVRAFESLDVSRFAPYYHLPCQFISPAGVTAINDEAMLHAVLGFAAEQARSSGYVRTEEVGEIKERRLSSQLTELSGTYRRLNAANEEITRFGFTYTLRETEQGWRIASAIIHDVITL